MKLTSHKSSSLLLIFVFLFVTPAQSQSQYIKVDGTHFILDGKPYYFTGTNFWYGCYLGVTEPNVNRERLIRELNRLDSAGITNLRILGASESSPNSEAVSPAIQITPGVYNDTLLIGLDFLLSEMNKRNMHAVIFLNNFWNWSGGMAQYLSWFDGGSGSWDTSPFYRNDAAKTAFKRYISDLINRRNTITGTYYYEDTAIMAWELANEPRPGSNSSYYNYFYQWIDSTAQYIHSLDSNHLVTTGNEGTMGSNSSESVYLAAHASSYIDYATIHVWVYNWSWYNPYNSSQTYPTAVANAKAYIQNHIGLARTLNKPLTMEEFGLPRDTLRCNAGSSTTMRDQYFSTLLKTVYDSAANGSPIAGTNFWGWGGEARSPNSDFIWRIGDPFMCDPPMEKQGLNSVYDTDSSTIQVLKEHALQMATLRGSNSVIEGNVVDHFILYQNYPNPFNPNTTIRYDLRERVNVQLHVYNILGQEIAVLVNEQQSAGLHFITFDATGLSTGVYFYRLIAGSYFDMKKMLVSK